MTVVEVLQRPVGPRRLEVALVVAPAPAPAVVPPGAVDAGAVGCQVVRPGVRAGVAVRLVGGHRQPLVGGDIGAVEAEPGVGASADRGEGAGDHDLAAVDRVHHHGRHRAVVHGQLEGGQGTGAERDGADPVAAGTVDRGEAAAEVDRRVGGRDTLDLAVGVGDGRGAHQGPGRLREVEDGHSVAGDGADLGEGADDDELRAVGCDGDVEDRAVDVGGERGVEDAGGQVVGQQVVPHHGVLAGRRPEGAGSRELAAGVDEVAADGLAPHDAVDLRRRQHVGPDSGGGGSGLGGHHGWRRGDSRGGGRDQHAR